MPNFADAIRPVFFQTDHEEYLYATHGGTLFIVTYRGRPYGITCGHVFGDFERERLVVARDKGILKGSTPGRIAGFAYPSSPRDGAVGTDVTDLCVVTFSENIGADFFSSPYLLSQATVESSQKGHSLMVAGVLKERTCINPPNLIFGYCRLEFQDDGSYEDPFLRQAVAEFASPGFTEITGLSGAPVFDQTTNRLCGMVVRGGMTGRFCRIYYMDATDIARFLAAVSGGAESVYYTKVGPVRPTS